MAQTLTMIERNDFASLDEESSGRLSDIPSSSHIHIQSSDLLVQPKAHPFPQVYKLRLEQAKTMDLSYLTPVQWGTVEIEKCHHISTTITAKDAPPSYRVRVCKTCCKQDNHIELGTYVDQESAVLINDVHEILQERYDKLIVLSKEDKPFLHLLLAKKYDRQCGKDHTNIMKILLERTRPRDEKRKRKRALDLINGDENISNGSKGSSSSLYGSHDTASTSQQGDESSSASCKLSNLDGYESDDNPITSNGSLQQTSDAITDAIADSPRQLTFPTLRMVSDLDAAEAAAALESAAAALAIVSKTNAIDLSLSPGRPRAATFAALSQSTFTDSALSPMTTLTWLATMKDDELDAARLLSELGGLDGCLTNNQARKVSRLSTDSDMIEEMMPFDHSRRARSLSLSYLGANDDSVHKMQASAHPMRQRANSFTSDVLAITHEIGFIGIYSPEERKKRIMRFLEKRKRRIWTKKVKYDVRKNFADSRIRVKGRFVRKEDEEQLKVTEGGVDVYRPMRKKASSRAMVGSAQHTIMKKRSIPILEQSRTSRDHRSRLDSTSRYEDNEEAEDSADEESNDET